MKKKIVQEFLNHKANLTDKQAILFIKKWGKTNKKYHKITFDIYRTGFRYETKEEILKEARRIFKNHGVKITEEEVVTKE